MELYDPHTACSLFLALSNAAPNVCADKVIGDHFLLPTPAGITSADYYVSEGDYLYQRHLSKPEANQIPLRKLPRAYYVRESISEDSLAALQNVFTEAEQSYRFTDVFINRHGFPDTLFGNGMSGDRVFADLPFTVTFDENGKANLRLCFINEDQFYHTGYLYLDIFTPADVQAARGQYRLITQSLATRRALTEVVASAVESTVKWDPALIEHFKANSGLNYFFFAFLQYYGNYYTLPPPVREQVDELVRDGRIDLEKLKRASNLGKISGGGWHIDNFSRLITARVPEDQRLRAAFQSLLMVNKKGMHSGGGTTIRARPDNPNIPYDQRPFAERVVARFKLQSGEMGIFSPRIGSQLYDHMAEPYSMEPNGTRQILFFRLHKGLPNEMPFGDVSFEQEKRSLNLPK